MATANSRWNDQYWLPLLQLFLRKPEGVKPIYNPQLVKLALELHIHPQFLYQQMIRLRQLDTPRLRHLWETYAGNPERLAKGVRKLRAMKGFRNSDAFYEGVLIQESWELDFKPLPEDPQIKPVMLILILDLFFRLTPNTMVPETPEIKELAKLIRLKPQQVAEIMDIFLVCDPYLNRSEIVLSPLLRPCQQIWKRYSDIPPHKLAAEALLLKEYFTT